MAPRTPEQVVATYNAQVTAVRAAVLDYAARVWRGQGAKFRDADVERLVGLLVPKVQAGQLKVANLTSAYIASVSSLRTGSVVEPVAVDEAAILGARGVPAEVVYERPVTTVRTALAQGLAFSEAVAEGARRLESIAATDVQMARVRQAQTSGRAAGWSRYRRVLVGEENCGLCVIASTQRYRIRDLEPIHPGCNCGVDELAGDEPDRQVIDAPLLEAIHRHVAEFTGGPSDRGARDLAIGKPVSDYTDLIVTRMHGEYGPTLSWRKDRFTTAAGLA